MIVNTVKVVPPHADAAQAAGGARAVDAQARPGVGAAAWIQAGGAHHTGFRQALTAEHLEDFAEMAGMECVLIDEETRLREFKNELRWNEAAYMVGRRFADRLARAGEEALTATLGRLALPLTLS